jgi:tRNA threonylcarbamoyladenosine biosynthesis protein TsaB
MSEPRLLLLETSNQPGLVALAQGNVILEVRRLPEARRHARDLAPAIGKLLANQGWRPLDIQAVAVSHGPGSYTGLRVGVVSAKTFCYATGSRLLALETFSIIADQAPADVQRLAVLADAQQDKVYIQEFQRTARGWLPTAPLEVRAVSAWLASTSGPIWASGPGLHKWAGRPAVNVQPVEAALWDPQAESMLRLALARYLAGETDDIWSAEPLYLRPSAAEEKWAATQATSSF